MERVNYVVFGVIQASPVAPFIILKGETRSSGGPYCPTWWMRVLEFYYAGGSRL